MENGTSYQSIGSRTIHGTNIDTELSDGDGNDVTTHQNGNDVITYQNGNDVTSYQNGNDVTSYQNGNGNGSMRHSPRSTEVVLDSRQRVTIKVKDVRD